MNINILLDVGANTGQYSQKIRKTGYKKNIVSFEPLSNAYKELKKMQAWKSKAFFRYK